MVDNIMRYRRYRGLILYTLYAILVQTNELLEVNFVYAILKCIYELKPTKYT